MGARGRFTYLAVVILLLLLGGCASLDSAPVLPEHEGTSALETTATVDQRLLYAFPPYKLMIYNMADYSLVKSVRLPGVKRPWGATAHAATNRLYVSYTHDDNSGRMLAYDLLTDKVLWNRTYLPHVDSLEVTPDGKTIYMASGENQQSDFWFVLNASNGNVRAKIPVYKGTHNTVVGLSGKRVYLASLKTNYLSVADTATNKVIKRIGPFSNNIRPFTVNAAETLTFVNVDFLSGFEVGDLTTGQRLYKVQVQGFPWVDPKLPITQSHGVALTPNEKEVWVVDDYNKHLHVFDVTGLPGSAPRQIASIALSDTPKWINFSRDGRFAHISTGEIVNARTRRVVTKIVKTKIRLQIDFAGGRPVAAYSRYGLGYGASSPATVPAGQH